MKRLYFVALCLSAAAIAPTTAWADKVDFQHCDGLAAPGKSGDGMRAPASTFGYAVVAGLDQQRYRVTACTAALADGRLLPEQNLRKAHLLRARALAHLGNGEPDKALADIDAAETAARDLLSDPLFARSMGVSFTLTRAAIWQAKGDLAKANELASAAAAARPYSVSVQSVAAALLQQSRSYAASGPSPYQMILPLVPDALSQLFASEVEAGNFAQAAKLYSRFNEDFPNANANAPLAYGMPLDARRLVTATLNAVGAAYAYAATGRTDQARALLTETRRKLDGALQQAPTGNGRVPPSNALAAPLNALYSQWSVIINARIDIAEKRPTDAMNALVGNAVPVTAAGLDLLNSLRAAMPEAQRALAPNSELLAAKLADQRKARSLNNEALQRAMPAPETSKRMAEYKRSSRSILNSLVASGYVPDGFRSKTDPATGITTVEFNGQSTSAPVVEEMTLLHAADLARQQGKRGLLIVARRDFARTMTMTQGYSRIPISSRAAGYKTELDVRFVDPAALSADLEVERDRILDADRVYSALAPVYVAATQTTRGR